jgi:hypothetical protein
MSSKINLTRANFVKYKQGFDWDCDVFLKLPIVDGVYPAVLYLMPRLFRGSTGRRFDNLMKDDVEIPEEYTEPLRWDYPRKQAMKIFFVDQQHIKFWRTHPPENKLTSTDLFNYIEKIRLKSFYKNLKGSIDEVATFKRFLFILKKKHYINNIDKTYINESFQLLFECNRLLKENEDLSNDLINILNEIRYPQFLEDWRLKSLTKNISVRIRAELKKIRVVLDKNLLTLFFDDFFKDIIDKTNYDICPNKYCCKIFQIAKGESKCYKGTWYCSKNCIDRSRRHKLYENNPKKYIRKSRKDRRIEPRDAVPNKSPHSIYYPPYKINVGTSPQPLSSKTETQDDTAPNWGQGI